MTTTIIKKDFDSLGIGKTDEIDYIIDKIEYEQKFSGDSFILKDVVKKHPEIYLNMMNIKDIEKYLRKKKINNINKKPPK